MTTMAAAPAKSGRWWLPLVEGILAILLGLMFLASPAITSMAFVFGLGFYWVVLGVVDLVRIFMDRTYWGWRLFNGILGILVGGLIVTGILGQNHPLGTAFVVGSAFTLVLACLTIVYGVIALIAAFRGEGWWPGVLGAIGDPVRPVDALQPVGGDAGTAVEHGHRADRRRYLPDHRRVPDALVVDHSGFDGKVWRGRKPRQTFRSGGASH